MGLDCKSFTDSETILLCEQLNTDENDVNVFFIIWAGTLVFLMHLGFAMLSAGAVRTKNTKNILLCIMVDACSCAVAWWLLGFGFAYGESAGGFLGTSHFVGIGIGVDFTYHAWFFQFAFAATAATIVSGAVAERATFEAYISYSVLLSIWVYPVVVHWVWGGGWLSFAGKDSLLGVGTFDLAGDGPVHMVGGVAGAIGSKLIGPRIGRFDSDMNPVDIPGHSSPLAFLGVFILWGGWFAFNSGSALAIIGSGLIVERTVVNTMLSSATGGISSLLFRTATKPGREWDMNAALNGMLAGLVAITGCCPIVETWAALIIGILVGPFYILASDFTLKVLHIDDPLDATPLHFFCGMFGIIMPAFFAKTEFVQDYVSSNHDFLASTNPKKYSGIFYGGNGTLLVCQIVEAIVIIVWVTAFIGPYFFFLKKMGWFRISTDAESLGLDASSHGGAAYPEMYDGLEGGVENKSRFHVHHRNASDLENAVLKSSVTNGDVKPTPTNEDTITQS